VAGSEDTRSSTLNGCREGSTNIMTTPFLSRSGKGKGGERKKKKKRVGGGGKKGILPMGTKRGYQEMSLQGS